MIAYRTARTWAILAPSQHRPECDPISPKEPLPPKLPNVQAVAGQLFDREGW